jgi:membrane-associated phospholipid phosphatase
MLGCFVLSWLVLVGRCEARPQGQQTDADSDTKVDATSGQNPGSTKDASEPDNSDPRDYDTTLGKHVLKDFAQDQKAIWTSPFHVRLVDAEWLVPLGGAAAAMFATDTEFSKHLNSSASRISTSNNIANFGIASLAAAGGGMYLWGHFTHNDHMRETGFLAGEAAADALAATYALKYTLGRERPLQDSFQGQFWQGGDSFPSEHSSAAWSIAGVIAHEYPGPLTSVVAYGLAAAVSSSRITAEQHFPSDVLIGSALGWFIGQEVYRHHHDPTLGGGEWETYAETHERGPNRPTNNVGSPYVELDSWIYPALERLVALDYIDDAFLGLRPWTRRECARLLDQAQDHSSTVDRPSREADQLIAALQKEFAPEQGSSDGRNLQLQLNSIYTRYTNISGEPLRDGYDFGQTIINDYGRPYAEGNNVISGADAWGTAGALTGYVRVEYQHAPSFPALPAEARQLIGQIDFLPEPPATPTPAFNQADLLEGYVALQLSNWQFSFGRQSLWWGPGEGTSLDLSDNAQPIDMIRINRTTPLKLPSILGWLGEIRTELFLGRLSGFEFIDSPAGLAGQWGQALPDQPFIHGENLSFKPTPNFEFGFYRTTIFSGEGYPFTPHSLIASVFDTGNAVTGSVNKPGKRTSGLDFSYRLPWLRDWATFYADGLTYDEFSPIAYPSWSAWHAGLYFPHFPAFPKLDLRVEGVYTDVPVKGGTNEPGSFYFNGTWRSGYTNNGNIIGSWIGRGGQGAQAWANYWFDARSRLQLNFRHQKVSKEFNPFGVSPIPTEGGTLTDLGVNADMLVRPMFSVSGSVQYETWNFPVISAGRRTDISSSIQITFWPGPLGRIAGAAKAPISSFAPQ